MTLCLFQTHIALQEFHLIMNIWWNSSFRLEQPDTEVDADAGL
ncbi:MULTISPECIES: hypothetical protein [Sphingobacterium]|nr:hypothetical protein [Sphingobacterium sp. E70]